MPHDLSRRPKFLRAGIARGLQSKQSVEETGGDSGAGIIRGMAIVTRGEALGHDLWIDQEFMSQVAEDVNTAPNGIKTRFTHPGLSGDGLGKFTGRVKNASLDGDSVRGDLHLSELSRDTPDGDLGGYLMALAQSDPQAFGNSIAFEMDQESMRAHMIENGAEWKTSGEGQKFLSGFVSPDQDNAANYPHARLKALRAVDAVDDPAANPQGLFHRGQEIADEAEALVAFSLGLTAERPQLVELDLDPDRVGGFIKRFLDRHDLAVVHKSKENAMPGKPKLSAEQPVPAEIAPAPETIPDEETDDEEEEPAEVAGAAVDASKSPDDGARFLAAFGDKGVWFAQGKTFEQAQQLFTAELQRQNTALAKENQELKTRLAGRRGESTPVSFGGDASPGTAEETKLKKLTQNLGPGLAKFAAGLTINRLAPSKN